MNMLLTLLVTCLAFAVSEFGLSVYSSCCLSERLSTHYQGLRRTLCQIWSKCNAVLCRVHRETLLLFYHLRLCLPSGVFHSGFLFKFGISFASSRIYDRLTWRCSLILPDV
jgi:hypothetical protein